MDIQKAPTKIQRGLSLLVYADPGVGKTTLATTLPQEETLLINTEAGLGPLLGTKLNIMNIGDGNVDDISKLYEYLRTQKHPFKYVVIDNISELEQWIILNLTKKRGKEFPEIVEYGNSSNKMREYLHWFRDLVYRNITIVFNAWEMPLEIRNIGGEVVTRTFPKLAKKISPELCGIVDIVAHLEVHEKSQKRWLRIGQSQQYVTKTQFKGLEAGEIADLPTVIDKVMNYEYGGKDDTKKGK